MPDKASDLRHLTGQFKQVTLLAAMYLLLLVIGVDTVLASAAFVTSLIHQEFVAIVWRLVLFHPIRKATRRKRVVWGFAILFFIFFASRLAVTIVASRLTAGTLGWDPWIRYPLITIILPPMTWALYSVFRYFGVYRALGADHFDPSYRNLPPEGRGIYRYTSNGMYTYAVLFMLLPGLLCNALDGLLIGLYHYGAVWVHYHATEKPDLRYIHGRKGDWLRKS